MMNEEDNRSFQEYSLLEKLHWLIFDQQQDITLASRQEIIETLKEAIDEISTN